MAKNTKKIVKKDALGESQSARFGQVLKSFGDHPSKGLTPQRLHRILEDAERGDITAQHELFADMEEMDGHIFAEMSKRRRAIITLPWTIQPPRNAPAQEKKLTDEVSEWIAELPAFDDVLLSLLDAIGHGFSALEIEWSQQGGVWLPATFHHRPQSWFQLTDNELRLKDGSREGQALWDLGWVVHTHQAKSGFLARAGLHRTLAWPYLFKGYSVGDLAEFLEIYGLPVRIGKYPSGASEEERATLFKAVQGIAHNAAGIISDGMLIEFQNAASGSHEPFKEMIEYCERTQSKAILGGTLTSQADGKSSTNALGNVHNEVRHDLRDSDAKQLAATLTQQIILPLLLVNKPGTDPRRLPVFSFDTQEAEDIALYAESLPKLVGLGMDIPVSWARKKLAIPEAQKGEPVLTLPRPEMTLSPEMRPMALASQSPYRPVALSQGACVYPDQAALDAVDLGDVEAHLRPMIDVVASQLSAGASYEEAFDILSGLYADLSSNDMQEVITRALFVADVWGRLNGR